MRGNERGAGAIASLGVQLWRYASVAVSAATALLWCLPAALADDAAKAKTKVPAAQFIAANRVETVRFADPRWPTVQIVRGSVSGTPSPLAVPQFRKTQKNTELVSFGDGTGRTVTVVRGSGLDGVVGASTPAAVPNGTRMRVETVHFTDPLMRAVAVVRGATSPNLDFALFAAANGGELDRVAFAIDGVESGHGSNLAMWRTELGGPQGPMQVSAAAALDVGGGNRFDLRENRMIGRAYIAMLYRRYGNWPDAIAAYNWGPGNVDAWITAGRPIERLPLETTHYLTLVLRNAFL